MLALLSWGSVVKLTLEILSTKSPRTILGSLRFNSPPGRHLSDVYSQKNTPLVGWKMLSHTLTHEKHHSRSDVSHHVLNLQLKWTFYVWGVVYGTIKHSFTKPTMQNDHFYIIKWSVRGKKLTLKKSSKTLENKSTVFLQAQAITVKTFSSSAMPVTKHLFAGFCHCGAAGKLRKCQT